MKLITKVIPAQPARKIRVYECDKCQSRYRTRKKALECESQPIEKKICQIGDLVKWREMRHCQMYDKDYVLKGKVVDIVGPTLPDEEYNHKWLQSKLSGKHIFEYDIKWQCPYCKAPYRSLFYGPELKRLEK